MRKNPVINSDIKDLIYFTLKSLNTFLGTEYCLPFLGTLLYLKKIGVNFSKKYPETPLCEFVSSYNNILGNDSIRNIVYDVLGVVSTFRNIRELNSILIKFGIEEFDQSEYLYWFDYAIENSCHNKSNMVLPIIPDSLIDLTQSLIGQDAGSVFIPFGGIMNFATNLEKFNEIDSFEPHRLTWQIGMLRLALDEKTDNVSFSHEIDFWPNKHYDTIISFPPMGIPVRFPDPSPFSSGKYVASEIVVPSRVIESTTLDGKCIAFAPTSLLFGSSIKRQFRVWAMEQQLIDTVILLPGKMLNGTAIQLACIVLSKKTSHPGSVRMIDASGMYTNFMQQNRLEVADVMNAYFYDQKNVSCTVSYEEIKNHDFSWHVAEYLQEEEECPDGFSSSMLEYLVSVPRLQTSSSVEKGLIVNISNLSDDWSNPYIQKENLTEESVPRRYMRLDREAILVSSVRKLKPSIIKASENTPVWINPNILAIIPSEEIDAKYLCMKLSELKIQTLDVLMQHISKTHLLRQKIVFPDLLLQRSLYAEASRSLAIAKAKDLGLQEVVAQMKTEYLGEVRRRKHDMKTPMTQLRNTFNLIKELANELPEEFASLLEKYVNRQQKAMDVLSDIVTHIADEDVFTTPETVDIEPVLKSFTTKTDRYVIEYHRDNASLKEAGIKTPELFIGKLDFFRLCQNIVENAINRGFVKDNADYALHISLSVENGFFIIDFSNNGEPFPPEIDKIKYGQKRVKGKNSNGSGDGGYIVKSITQHYGGDYDIFSSKFANMDFTNVIVKLPIYRREDE